MKARENTFKKKPCVHCGTPTVFFRYIKGPRGGLSYEDCCVDCGEQPARREKKT